MMFLFIINKDALSVWRDRKVSYIRQGSKLDLYMGATIYELSFLFGGIMNNERDFKGVWIPKEIWLNAELTLLEKCLFVEIDSLDNESHCTAGNDYFAKFLNCSESAITKAIKKLIDIGLIEVLAFDGRKRTIQVVNESRKIYEAAPQNLRTNNIYNNIISKDMNNKVLSKDNTATEEIEFDFGIQEKPKKKNLFDKCLDMIYEWTNDRKLQDLLVQYLKVCLEMKSIRGANQWKGMLNTLEKVQLQCQPHTYEEIIEQAIIRGWKTFYPIKDYVQSNNSKFIHIQKSSEFVEPEGDELKQATDENGKPMVY